MWAGGFVVEVAAGVVLLLISVQGSFGDLQLGHLPWPNCGLHLLWSCSLMMGCQLAKPPKKEGGCNIFLCGFGWILSILYLYTGQILAIDKVVAAAVGTFDDGILPAGTVEVIVTTSKAFDFPRTIRCRKPPLRASFTLYHT